MARLIRSIDTLTWLLGQAIAWLTLLMMLAMSSVVVLRYGFDVGSIALQESVTYLHATVFMLGAAYTLQRNGHVRVDIFYRRFSASGQALVDCLGGIVFLLPLCIFTFLISWDYVAESWAVGESSSEPGGIPGVWLLKTLLLLMPATLGLQAIAEILRNGLRLAGRAVPGYEPDAGDLL